MTHFDQGISSLVNARHVIAGGSNAQRTTIYNPAIDKPIAGQNMQIPRGYQSLTILSNSKAFTTGGSWSSEKDEKASEIFNSLANTWTVLPGADVGSLLTCGHEGAFRTDNHAWLIPWRDSLVF
jgi:galactose oxidase